jgi:hypothetical protein
MTEFIILSARSAKDASSAIEIMRPFLSFGVVESNIDK